MDYLQHVINFLLIIALYLQSYRVKLLEKRMEDCD